LPSHARRLYCLAFPAAAVMAVLLAPPPALSGGGPPSGKHDSTPRPSSGEEAGARASGNGFTDTLFWAPEILVEGYRIGPEEAVTSRSGFVAVVDLTKRRHRVEDAAAILSRSVGVQVRRYGGLGSFATMSIRGSSSSQVQFYLDGVPLNDPYSGLTYLCDIPTGDLERIEIYRGTSPTGFGSSSIGGTVNLVTGRAGAAEEGFDAEAFGSAGSFGIRRINAAVNGERGPLSLRLGGGYIETRGDFQFLDDNGTPQNPDDDEPALRRNNDFNRWNLSGRLGLEAGWFDNLSLSYTEVFREGGIPGIGSNQSAAAGTERDRRITYLKIRPSPLCGRRFHLEGTGFYSWTADRFHDPGGEIGLRRQSTDNRIITKGGNIRARIFITAARLSLEAFLEGRGESYVPRDLLPEPQTGPERRRRCAVASASAELGLAGERIFLGGGLRHEWSRSEFWEESIFAWIPPTPAGPVEREETTPSLGFKLVPLPWITIKGNWGEHYRMPTFFEMFGNAGTVAGSPDLEPERGFNRDIGIVCSGDELWMIGRPRLEAVYLDNDLEELILFFQNSQYTVKPRNIGSARIRGFELSASGTLAGSLRLCANYCRLDSRDTSPIPYYNGNMLPGRPGHEASVAAELFGERWSVVWELHYMSGNYLDRANLVPAEARSIHDIAVLLRPSGSGVSLSFAVSNAGDETIYDVIGFPLPGRSFFATIGYGN
jgi:outer membrane cobalamin receptor